MRASDDDSGSLIDSLRGARGRREIAARVRAAISQGQLRDGDALPSTRVLAADLGVSRGSVVQAYDELVGEGFLVATPGGGTCVAASVSARTPPEAPVVRGSVEPAVTPRIDLRPGRPATSGLAADPAWRAAWRRGADAVPADTPDLAGDPGLRAEIAAHVRRTRGVMCEASDVFVTAGTADAFLLVLLTLRRRSPRLRVGVEDPGYRFARRTLIALGEDPVPIPVCDGSIDPESLPALDAVIVTPSHQYPLGGAMPVARRYALLEWARASGALVIEDDYDSEFRHGAPPLPAITGLIPSPPAVLVGTFSKTVSPSLRLGYLVVPDASLAAEVRRTRELLSIPVAQQLQDAAREFLAGGGYRRHIARVRRAYAHRRALVASVAVPEGVELSALEGGLHAVISWPQGSAAGRALRDRLTQAGIACGVLADYRIAASPDDSEGIVLGYAAVTDLQLDEALAVIAGV